MIEQGKVLCSPVGKSSERQTKIMEDQRRKLVKTLKVLWFAQL